jgi:hypothetical protein
MSANDRQIGGSHYKAALQHWDLAILFKWDYIQARLMAYVMRWRDKKKLEDLEKAQHFLEKYIEEIKAGHIDTTPCAPLPREAWLAMLGVHQPMASVGELSPDMVAAFKELGITPPVIVPPGYGLVPLDAMAPTGWKAYTYEGSKGVAGNEPGDVQHQDWYRCKACRQHFAVPLSQPPVNYHRCQDNPPMLSDYGVKQ